MTSSTFKHLASALTVAAGLFAGAAQAQTAICYNCPPEWADWAAQLRAIKEHTGVTVPPDNKNSGQALAQLLAEKKNPVADVVYMGVSFAAQAMQDGTVTHPTSPPNGMKSRTVSRIRTATG